MKKPISSSDPQDNLERQVPPPWNGIPSGIRQGKACSCAYTVLKILGGLYGVPGEKWDMAFAKLGKSGGLLRRALGHPLDEADILSMLAMLGMPHELLKPLPELLDARLAAGDAVICSFEQYTSGYVKSALQKARMLAGNRSEHSILVVGRVEDGYLAFDPGWARGGWQVVAHPVMKRVLREPMNTLIAVAPPGRGAKRILAEGGGELFVNGYNGHWVYLGGGTMDGETSDYLYRNEEIVLPFQQETVFAPTQFVVKITNRCNSGCRYCYVDSMQRGRDMSPACFEKVVESAYRLSRKQPILVILHGGEPLLVLKSYGEVLAGLKAGIPGLRLSMQTSALGLDDGLMDIIERNGIQVGVSLDGPENIHNAQRSGFHETMRALAALKGNRLFSGTISTLTGLSCRHMAEILDFLVENGFRSIAFSPAVPAGRGARSADLSPTPKELGDAYIVAWERLLQYRERGLPVEMREFSRMLVHLVSNIRPGICGYTPCAACRHILGVDVRGNAYACDMLIGDGRFDLGPLSELDEAILDGKFPDGPFGADAPDRCRGCNQCHWRKNCMRGCPSNNIFFGTQGSPSHYCQVFRRILERMAVDISTRPSASEYVEQVAMAELKKIGILDKRDLL